MRYALVATFLFAGTIAPAFADPPSEARGTMLDIAAEGVSSAVPDMASITLGVVSQDRDVAAATAENAQAMNGLLAALRTAGVAQRDIRTEGVSIEQQQEYYDDNRPPRITGFEARNEVRVRVHDVNRMGPVIDAALAAGGNFVSGISFGFNDATAQLDLARRAAFAEARRRAELYADAAGLRVVRIVTMSESGARGDEAIVVTGSRIARRPEPTQILPGEVDTRVTVNVTFELR